MQIDPVTPVRTSSAPQIVWVKSDAQPPYGGVKGVYFSSEGVLYLAFVDADFFGPSHYRIMDLVGLNPAHDHTPSVGFLTMNLQGVVREDTRIPAPFLLAAQQALQAARVSAVVYAPFPGSKWQDGFQEYVVKKVSKGRVLYHRPDGSNVVTWVLPLGEFMARMTPILRPSAHVIHDGLPMGVRS